MKDRYRTEDDGRPARFDPSEIPGNSFSMDRVAPIALVLVALGLIYMAHSNGALAKRIESVEASRKMDYERIEGVFDRVGRLERIISEEGQKNNVEKVASTYSVEEVKDVQQMLAVLSYYSEPINGRFGNATEVAMKRFQSAQDLEPTGDMADSSFREALRSALREFQGEAQKDTGGQASDLSGRLKRLRGRNPDNGQ